LTEAGRETGLRSNETGPVREDAVAELQAMGRAQRKDQLRAVRRALGLSAAALARERGLQVREIFRQEEAEWTGRIALRTLAEAAGALGCELAYALVPRTESIRAMALRTRTERKEAREQAALKKKLDSARIIYGIDALRFAARLELKKYGIVIGPRARRGRPPRRWVKPLWLPLIEEVRKDLASGAYETAERLARGWRS
jgi:transcriptional regulator with XRE-family HTH domain